MSSCPSFHLGCNEFGYSSPARVGEWNLFAEGVEGHYTIRGVPSVVFKTYTGPFNVPASMYLAIELVAPAVLVGFEPFYLNIKASV